MSEKKDSKRPTITTPFFRLSFPNLNEPRSNFEGNEPTYNLQMLFPKDPKTNPKLKAMLDAKLMALQISKVEEMKKLVKEVARKKWGDTLPGTKKNPFKWPLQDGADKELEAYQGMIYANSKSKFKPGVLDAKKNEILNIREDLYPGCWCRATVSVFAFEIKDKKTGAVLSYGVSFGLNNVQKAWDDESFSGKRNAQDDFEEIEVSEETDFTDEESEESEDYDSSPSAMDF